MTLRKYICFVSKIYPTIVFETNIKNPACQGHAVIYIKKQTTTDLWQGTNETKQHLFRSSYSESSSQTDACWPDTGGHCSWNTTQKPTKYKNVLKIPVNVFISIHHTCSRYLQCAWLESLTITEQHLSHIKKMQVLLGKLNPKCIFQALSVSPFRKATAI